MLKCTFVICLVLYGTCAKKTTNSRTTASNCLKGCTADKCSSDDNYYDPNMTNRTFGQSTTNSCTCQCCGIRIQKYDSRVMGAVTTATHHEFPWIVAILKVEDVMGITKSTYKCVGSLIHPKVVLTVAHHVSREDRKSFLIRAGQYDTENSNEDDSRYDRTVSRYVVHNRYNSDSLINDIALLFLVDAYVIGRDINLICLPPLHQNFDSQRCLVSGWGKDAFDEEGRYSTSLRTVELPIVPKSKCLRELKKDRGVERNYRLHESFICAGGEIGVDTCQGDGGAPLVCPIANTNRYHQVGIVSRGVGCGGPPGVYVNVPLFIGWINSKLKRYAEN